MAKVKVINSNLDGNLNGTNFNDTPSNTIFSFGRFFVTTNFDNKTTINYTNTLSSFTVPVTLDGLNINDTQSEIMNLYTNNAVLNLDKTDLNTFVKFGSAYEFLRVAVQNIILAYPGSLFANSQKRIGGNTTFTGLTYDEISNISTFYVPLNGIDNKFGLITNNGNEEIPDENELKNLNLSYEDYVVWSTLESNKFFTVVGYTGNTDKHSDPLKRDYIRLEVEGNPFAELGTGTTGLQDFHIRPNNMIFEEFRALLNPYERNLVSKRNGTTGFEITLKEPNLLEDGKILYYDKKITWSTSDKYNIDIDTPSYQNFLAVMLAIGTKYDKVKTDLIARFLTPASLKSYDFTDEGKTTKLLRLYGREFDQMKEFIDSLVHINKLTYDKKNNIPDQLIQNMARTFGWDYFGLVNESELVESFLTVDDTERNLNENELPAEVDIELWRRILMNTSYFWKSKGTRQAIKAIFLLIGIPEPFINITEYVYTVDGKINPNTVTLTAEDFPSNSLPYDNSGYPVAPLETNDFFFQLSGNTDSGQAYLDVFRQAGFNLKQTPDNKKSWIQTGATTRQHYSTSQYYQEDSRLVINTKEVDVALDTARGIEYDVYDYIQTDFAANSSGYTLPYSYVNISNTGNLEQTGHVFKIPASDYSKLGDMEVRYNGILLNAPSTGTTGGTYFSGDTTYTETQADYTVSGNTITIPQLSGKTRPSDVIQVTFIDSGTTTSNAITSAITINYIVTRIKADLVNGTYIPLPSYPRGDVQLTINGIALTKGTPQFTADYIVDPANSTGGTSWNLIIQNPDIITFLNSNPYVQISYMEVQGSNDINLRSEVFRVDSFSSSKIYFNNSANKYVYKLNYKVNQASDVKFLIDGIALEPYLDYSVNVMSPYEIFLPRGIRYGSVISAYYLVGGAGAFDPVINDIFGLGDISELSFLEFLELVQRKMINARNRKIVTDFKGGWYPAVLAIYEKYLQRAELPDDDPLQSNGYTFQNLYSFLSKYNAFFQRFVDQLLPATIIRRRGGLLVRNTLFTKQKHWYKRGVNVADPSDPTKTLRGNDLVQYLGDGGSMFQIYQDFAEPPPPLPPEMYVETKSGITGSLITGGKNILNYDAVTEYGIEYKRIDYYYGGGDVLGLQNLLEGIDYDEELIEDSWVKLSLTDPLTTNDFTLTLTGLDEGATYEYRAFVESLASGFTGNTLSVTIPVPVPDPSVDTKTAVVNGNILTNLGGINVVRYEDVEYYGIQYRKVPFGIWQYQPNPPATGPLAVNYYQTSNITGLDYGATYQYLARIVVDGVAYFGATLEATMGAQPTNPYSVTSSTTTFKYSDGTGFNAVSNSYGGSPSPTNILSAGIIYTQNSSQAGSLTITNTNSSVHNTLATPTPSGASGTFAVPTDKPLLPNTQTWYRAFVQNGDLYEPTIGYGQVEDLITGTPPPSTFLVAVDTEWTGSAGYGFVGQVRLMQGGTVVDTDHITSPKTNHTFGLEGIVGQTYTIDLQFLAKQDLGGTGNTEIADQRWRKPPNLIWTPSPTVTDVQDPGDSPDVEVFDFFI